jgi:hypothetical protein
MRSWTYLLLLRPSSPTAPTVTETGMKGCWLRSEKLARTSWFLVMEEKYDEDDGTNVC